MSELQELLEQILNQELVQLVLSNTRDAAQGEKLKVRPVLIRERMAALATDAIRAGLLEQNGYDTQILEFIDMEHTPKNLMIRAVKTSGMRSGQAAASIGKVMEFLHVNPTLKELL